MTSARYFIVFMRKNIQRREKSTPRRKQIWHIVQIGYRKSLYDALFKPKVDIFTPVLWNPHNRDSKRTSRASSHILISEFSEGYRLRKKILDSAQDFCSWYTIQIYKLSDMLQQIQYRFIHTSFDKMNSSRMDFLNWF